MTKIAYKIRRRLFVALMTKESGVCVHDVPW